MRTVLKAELYRLHRDGRNLFLVLISMIVGFVLLSADGVRTGSEALYRSFYNMALLFLVADVFIALYLGENFTDRHIDRYVAAGHGRGDIVRVQHVVSVVYTNVILMAQPILAAIIFSVRNGWGDLYTASEGALIILSIFFLNASLVGAVVFLAFLLKRPGSILVTSGVLYFLAIFLLNSKKALAFARVLPMGQARLLIEGGTTPLEALAVAVAYFAAFCYLTTQYFRTCDVK
ncbi:MAG: ABC transporter permease [Peptoniphilus sp.]|nr:ABC transporter permease [Peptoniphilus sp.]MDD7363196.1 ABC transporter permease [Bacillota bacterium]MDY6044480.1 ABC transporter permease [Peptoniphilus sp.]